MKLDAATFLLQWSSGGLLFAWVTTRRREVGLGYGWLLRVIYGVLALGAALAFMSKESSVGRSVAVGASCAAALAASAALASSIARRRAGVSLGREREASRRERVAAMGIERPEARAPQHDDYPEFAPALDLVAPVFGLVGILAAAELAGGGYALTLARLLLGALLLGAVSDAMLLGHWYLVQPGLGRGPLRELVVAVAGVWPFHVVAFLLSPGMVQVLGGSIDDGSNGLLGWVWWACVFATIALVGVTWAALRERYYSAVMSATGLLYLAILTAFGQDLVARAVLAP